MSKRRTHREINLIIDNIYNTIKEKHFISRKISDAELNEYLKSKGKPTLRLFKTLSDKYQEKLASTVVELNKLKIAFGITPDGKRFYIGSDGSHVNRTNYVNMTVDEYRDEMQKDYFNTILSPKMPSKCDIEMQVMMLEDENVKTIVEEITKMFVPQ